jgi:methionine sulfoxide reductase catalytic subunit
MKTHKTRSWELPDSAVTPEADYLRRREFLRVFGLGLAATALLPPAVRAATAGFPDSLNPTFKLDGVKLTPYDLVTSYNNFYEWGLAKEEPKEFSNKGWKTEPWTIEIGGLCSKPGKYDVNDLVKIMGGIEQRNYRHRCVEAWSMVVPWDGFPLARLVALTEPKSEAKYVQFTTFFDPAICPGQRSKRTGLPGDRHLWKVTVESKRRANPPRRPVEIRIQGSEVPGENRLRFRSTKDSLEPDGAQ